MSTLNFLVQKSAKESDNPEPYTIIAECKLEAEKELQKIPDLNYVIRNLYFIYDY